MGLWPLVSQKIRLDTILICMSFSIKSTARNSNLEGKPETEVVLCVIFCEKPPKIAENRSALREFEAASKSGGLGDAPRSPVRLRIRRVFTDN